MGDIERLVQIAPPDIAVLTKVAMAHVANFPGGVPEIAKGKAQIFSQPKTRAAVFDHGLYEFPEAMAQIGQGKISFSLENRNADYFLSFSEGKCVVDERGVRACSLDLPFRQAHFLHNLLASSLRRADGFRFFRDGLGKCHRRYQWHNRVSLF